MDPCGLTASLDDCLHPRFFSLPPSLLYSSAGLISFMSGSLSVALSPACPPPISFALSAGSFALLRPSSCVCGSVLVSFVPPALVFLCIRLLRFLSV